MITEYVIPFYTLSFFLSFFFLFFTAYFHSLFKYKIKCDDEFVFILLQGLRATDINGLADPYCLLILEKGSEISVSYVLGSVSVLSYVF